MAKRPVHHKSDSDEEKPRNKRRYDPRDKREPEPESTVDRSANRTRGRGDDWDDDWQGTELAEVDEELDLEETDEWDEVDPESEDWEEDDPLEYDDDDR
ncbi:MAG TPA: hypothetical protein PLL30_00230 [Candidatus Krumholzibacteria bacterium]|nr:hypothetical protein [Candidatus Krumholzibacteria bacterium]HPD70185.1 hypothetical protein [Candidatus Krumholzibacteria bacterium]HRY40115.1 hypothetical protein [Candidatus Krumholzibacteria bacterium]